MSAPARPPERRPGFLLHDISHLLRREFDRRVEAAELGLTRAQWLILRQVAQHAGCSQRDVAARIRLKAPTVGRHIEHLRAAGWIERRNDARDHRAYRLYPRPKARRTLACLTQLGTRMREDFFAGIPPARREALIDDLLVIRRNLLACQAQKNTRVPCHAAPSALRAAR
jgi:MarR family transcriptional regulator for hemolysin